jgi:oligosaccharyl transferase (archaeosortase A-associated)
MTPKKVWYSSPWLIVGLIALFFGVSFYLRAGLPYSQVFTGDWVKYTTTDAYYFVRQIDNLVANFPHFFMFDPYQLYPTGTVFTGQNMFVYFVSSIIWLIGLGHPSPHLVDLVSAYIPAILGALAVVPVFFIGKALFNRWVGVLSAALIAITPGEFLGRTILGNTDRDPFEVILSALTILFLILAVKSAREKQLTFKSLSFSNIRLFKRPLIYSGILGLVLGIFTLTWRGSFIFVFIILLYFIIQTIVDHFRKQSPEYLQCSGIVAMFITLVIFLIGSQTKLFMVALVLSLLTLAVLTGIERILAAKKAKPYFYPLTIVIIAAAGLGIFYGASPSTFHSIVDQFSVFLPRGVNLTVSQMQPILFPGNQFSLLAVWGNFTTGIILIFFSLGILVYNAVRRPEPGTIIFIVWSVTMLVATLLTRRIALLFALNVALLVGYFGWSIIKFMIDKSAKAPALLLVTQPAHRKKGRVNEPRKVRQGFLARNQPVVLIVTGLAVFFLIFYPEISPAVDVARQASANAPDDDWYRALNWMKEKTPDPMGDPEAYLKYYKDPVAYPDSAYGVASWWDYGYWIMRVAHRMPISDPAGGAREQVATAFTSQTEEGMNAIMDQYNVKYVVLDDKTITNKFRGVTTYAGVDAARYGDYYYTISNNTITAANFYYLPDYFQNMAVRLFRFDALKYTPTKTTVVSYLNRVSRDGVTYKEVVSTKAFTRYEEATAYIASQTTGNYQIVSETPLQSPVPLEACQHYREVFPTSISATVTTKVFEYTP